jgi:hypothetical protein
MPHTSKNSRTCIVLLFALAVLLILAVGCSHDCQWDAKAQAFLDDNRNGTWDQGESALSGVTFHVADDRGKARSGSWESDSTGNAFIAFFVSCDERTEFLLFATPPDEYVGTTPDHVDAGSRRGNTFTFGFIKEQ